MTTFRRVPRDPNVALAPGLYELSARVTSGDAARVTRQSLEDALRLAHGPQITVVDYQASSQNLFIRFQVGGQHQAGLTLIAWPGIVITGAAILAVLWLSWQIATEVTELVQIVTDAPPSVHLLMFGVVLLAVAAVALFWKN